MAISETPTGTLDPIPDLVKETLEKLDIRPEQIRFAVQSDVNSTGSYGEEWFALTDAAIFTVTGEGEVLHYIPYEKVLGIRAEVVVDAGLLVLETADGTVDLIRYSNGCAAKFGMKPAICASSCDGSCHSASLTVISHSPQMRIPKSGFS